MSGAGPGLVLVDAVAAAGVLEAADVHVARALARLGPESDERVLLAAALAVRAARLGSVCVDLPAVAASIEGADDLPWPAPQPWLSACAASPLVAQAPGQRRPLHLAGTRLYLDRYWQDEQAVRTALAQWGRRPLPAVDTDRLLEVLGGLFAAPPPDHQALAAAAAATGWFTVLAGGPGTGKTTTVARLLATLQAVADRPLRVALAAPTGKAAARLQEAVAAELSALAEQGRPVPGPYRASTVHRLLGTRPGLSTRFRHDRVNRLPHDVVVVDEASMLSLTMVARLLEALRPDCRLVLVGDPDQLVSVEAGAVLGDVAQRVPRPAPDARTELVGRLLPADVEPAGEVGPALRADVVRLRTNHRFAQAAALVDLADAVRRGDQDEAVAVLRRGDPSIQHVDVDPAQASAAQLEGLRDQVVGVGAEVVDAARAGDADRALRALGRHRLLCAHREGRYGVAAWGERVRGWLAAAVAGYGLEGDLHPGRPLLVTANDHDAGLYNGDLGVVVARPDGVVAAFGPGGPVVPTSRLPAVLTPYAMTVHKAQGSEADAVTVVLPDASSPLLTRELLYTAITRARSQVRVVGTEESVRRAVARPIVRASGLREG